MIALERLEVWFVTGSQHLYGPQALKKVQANAREIAGALGASGVIPVKVVFKPLVTGPAEATAICQQAGASPRCIGLITWCHTFSPSKMWINGLKLLQRPLLHLHTQHNRDLPWETIDMDFMNLNQAAHGDREHGFIMSRMKLNRKVVVGHWAEKDVQERIAAWTRAAAAWHDWQNAKFCRFGDNMREVAVTEGDKVAAQIQFGYSVNGYGVGDLVQSISEVGNAKIDKLVEEYEAAYTVAPSLRKNGDKRESLRETARIEFGLRAFLKAKGAKGFTDTFEDLHGLAQLPGLPVQRLMAEGYGFGAEGDWKTAALLRAMKVMGAGLKGGTSFMEDYTYHLHPSGAKVLGAHMLEVCPSIAEGYGFGAEGDWKTAALLRAMKVMGAGLQGGTSFMEDYTYHLHPSGAKVLGAHMLEICPSIAEGKPSLEIHPLGIGGKADPVRLVFDTPSGPALNASMVDMGGRFRLLVNEVDVVPPDKPLAKLPVARAVWTCRPDFPTAVAAWIYGGGAHHTGFSQAVTTEMLEDFATIAGVELLIIDNNTRLREFRKELRANEIYYTSKA